MSSRSKLTATNLDAADLQMDTRGHKDPRYYCLPPFRGDRNKPGGGGGYPWHLVFQGERVGVFNNWALAQTSVSGFPAGGNKGYHSEEECIDAWQDLCVLGVHPHPVDPAFATPPAREANASPRKTPRPSTRSSPVKQEPGAGDKKLLADLKRYCSPILPPAPAPSTARSPPASPSSSRKGGRSTTSSGPFINFVIRGEGVISSSAERSAKRYRELQQRGEQPDMLVTRSLEQASVFALEESEDEDGVDGS